MKQLLICISIMALTLSCNSQSIKQPIIIDETFTTPQDSLYLQCEGLKGFGSMLIGKTTWNQYLVNKEIQIPKVMRYSSFSGSYWEQGKILDSDERYALARHLEKCGFKVAEISNNAYPYKIGEIKFENISGAFLNDTLVAIYVPTTYLKGKEALREHYTQKYGKGNGSHYSYDYTNWTESRAKSNKVHAKTIDKYDVTWENSNVRLQFHRNEGFETDCGKIQHSFNEEWYLLTSAKRYNAFLDGISSKSNDFLASKKENEQSEMNSL